MVDFHNVLEVGGVIPPTNCQAMEVMSELAGPWRGPSVCGSEQGGGEKHAVHHGCSVMIDGADILQEGSFREKHHWWSREGGSTFASLAEAVDHFLVFS